MSSGNCDMANTGELDHSLDGSGHNSNVCPEPSCKSNSEGCAPSGLSLGGSSDLHNKGSNHLNIEHSTTVDGTDNESAD